MMVRIQLLKSFTPKATTTITYLTKEASPPVPDINKILVTLNAKLHLLLLVQTTNISGSVKFSAPVSNEAFNLQSIL